MSILQHKGDYLRGKRGLLNSGMVPNCALINRRCRDADTCICKRYKDAPSHQQNPIDRSFVENIGCAKWHRDAGNRFWYKSRSSRSSTISHRIDGVKICHSSVFETDFVKTIRMYRGKSPCIR